MQVGERFRARQRSSAFSRKERTNHCVGNIRECGVGASCSVRLKDGVMLGNKDKVYAMLQDFSEKEF